MSSGLTGASAIKNLDFDPNGEPGRRLKHRRPQSDGLSPYVNELDEQKYIDARKAEQDFNDAIDAILKELADSGMDNYWRDRFKRAFQPQRKQIKNFVEDIGAFGGRSQVDYDAPANIVSQLPPKYNLYGWRGDAEGTVFNLVRSFYNRDNPDSPSSTAVRKVIDAYDKVYKDLDSIAPRPTSGTRRLSSGATATARRSFVDFPDAELRKMSGKTTVNINGIDRTFNSSRKNTADLKIGDLVTATSGDTPSRIVDFVVNPESARRDGKRIDAVVEPINRPGERYRFSAPPNGTVESWSEAPAVQVTRPGSPRNRFSRRTQIPREVSRGLASGASRNYVPTMTDEIRAKIAIDIERAKPKFEAKPMSMNAEYNPSKGEWLLEGAKILELFKDENGKRLPNSEIANILGIPESKLNEITAEGVGIPQLDVRVITEAIYMGMKEGGSPILSALSRVNLGPGRLEGEGYAAATILDYPDIIGTQLWGFGYSPYWVDMTEGETITAIGASADQKRRAKESFAAFLEDGEILRTVRPMPEPLGFEDDLSDVVITRSAPIQGAVRSEGSLVPQSEVQSPSNFPLSKLLSYLGAEEGNDIDAIQKLVDTGINISPQGFRNWASGGVSSEYVEHLVNRGVIPSAAAVFGPEVGNFDSMLTYGDFYERLLAFADANGIKKSSIGKLAGKTSTRDVENQVNSWKKRKAEAKTVTGKTLSGTKTKISDSEIDSIIKKVNDLNKANGKPEITREDVINPKNRGLSSGKRVVNVTPSEARKQTARMNIKYPNLSKAYNSVSDIPTPERLNGRALSSGRRQEIYDTLTKTVIDQMEKARATGSKWSFPWHKGRMAPRNSSTSSRYRGINHIMLSIAQEEAGYEKPVWGTFKQWQAMGGSVKKGEKGTPIIFWSRVEYDDKDNPGEKKTKAILKESYVFNLDQVEGIDRSKFDEPETLSEDLRRTDIDDIRSALGINLTHAGDRAYFSPNDDKIVMPPFGEFKTPEGYYGTLLHEITHWTGHRDRLNRDNMHQYKSEPDYAFEELIAELGTAYLMSMLDVTVEPREDHAQYLAFWIQKLQNDPDALMRAATLAQKAADYIIENVPALREAQEKADRIADEARAEAKKRAEDAASARPKTGGRSSTTRRPNTRKRK